MANSYFQFKQFIVHQDRCAMKVTTDACLFGAWVAEKIRGLNSETGPVLDIGTGTGLLSLMLKQKNPGLEMDAIEIDDAAAEQAKENFDASPWREQINVFRADAKEFGYQNKYNIIISNPPFYDRELKGDDTKKNLAHHNEGLLLPDLMTIIKTKLNPGGTFFLLLPYKRNEEIKKLLLENELVVSQITFVRQSVKHDYFRMMLEGKPEPTGQAETMLNEIAIRNETGEYTTAFVSLLKDYYFNL